MIINAQRTKILLVNTRGKEFQPCVYLGDFKIEVVTELKILGFAFDRSLKFNGHVINANSKIKSSLRALMALTGAKWGPSPLSVKVLYCSMLESY